MENLILIIFLILVICFMFLIIINKQDSRQVEQSYLDIPVLVPYYRWWTNWWPYYYGSGSSTYYSTYRYPRHRRHRPKKSITIIADKTGKTHVAYSPSVIPVTISGKRDNIRLARMKNNFTNIANKNKISIKIPNKLVSNNKVLLLAKSKMQKK